MKLILVFLGFFVALSQARLSVKEVRRYINECILITGIEKKLVMKIIKTQEIPEDNALYKQFLNCLYLKQGYQNDKGEMLYDNIKDFMRKFYSDEDIDKALNPCKELKREKLASENAFVALKCIIKNLKAVESEKSLTEDTNSSSSTTTSSTVTTTTTTTTTSADDTGENATTDIYSAIDNGIANDDNTIVFNNVR